MEPCLLARQAAAFGFFTLRRSSGFSHIRLVLGYSTTRHRHPPFSSIQRMPTGTMGSDEAPTATILAPPLTDPYSWFDFYDRDASNTLDQEEVISGLYNTLQIAQKNSSAATNGSTATTVDAIRESIQAIWPAFDIDGNGQVSVRWGNDELIDSALIVALIFISSLSSPTTYRDAST